MRAATKQPQPKPTHTAVYIHPPTDAAHPHARHATPRHAQVYGDSQAQKDAETRAHHRSLRRSVSAALRALSPEERQFLRMKYGLDDGKTKTTRYATHTHAFRFCFGGGCEPDAPLFVLYTHAPPARSHRCPPNPFLLHPLDESGRSRSTRT